MNIKIMKNKPEISDEEIQGYMDFDKLLEEQYRFTQSGTKLKFLKIIGFSSSFLAILFFGWLYFNPKHEEGKVPSGDEKPLKAVDNLISLDSIQSNDSPPLAKDLPEISHLKKPIQQEEIKIPKEKKHEPPQITDSSVKKIDDQKEESIYVQAEPVEGYPQLYQYLNDQLQYPEDGIRDSIQGITTLSITLNEKGQVENIEILKSLGPTFDQEALRLIQNMPPWKPATLNQRPVKSKISIPLTFEIKKIKAK